MQKSKKMMVSLCGLALSSLFVLNNKSVVHADTVDGSQSNAISWDSDSDDSQVVQESQTKTKQAMPQKADNSQQNVAQPVQNNAETSTVRSSSAAPRTTNQNTAVQSPKISNINDAQAAVPVVINDPAYDTVHVRYVDTNGNDVDDGSYDYDIDATETGQGSYSVPDGYSLNNPDGEYTISSGAFNGTNFETNGETNKIDNPQNNMIHVKFVDQQTGQDVGGSYGIDVSQFKTKKDANFDDDGFTADAGTYKVPSGYVTQNNKFTVDYKFRSGLQHILSHYTPFSLSDIMSDDQMARLYQDDEDARNTAKADGYSNYDVNTSWIELGPYGDLKEAAIGSGVKVDELNSINDGDLVLWLTASGASSLYYKPTHLSQYELHQIWSNYATNYADEYGGLRSDGTPVNSIVLLQEAVPIGISDKGNVVNGNIVTVPVHKTKSFSFADNSGNVRSVNGNTVNVVLTKPQSVNPAMDTRCQSQATRTIQINFPDGQIPEAYDGIVDKSGKLVQTVHFTRTATEDALTGNILSYGNWTSDNQDPNFIGFSERTLPKIPGYTLSIKPA